jgi:steroid 5-alpha reductase family enzyme
MQSILIHSFIAIVAFILVVYAIAQFLKDNSIVDIAWGIGFIIATAVACYESHLFFTQNLLVNILTLIWGLRLSIYIFVRHSGKGEDYRYKEMREGWGNNVALMGLLKVFLPQAVIMFIIAFPILVINCFPHNSLRLTDIAGAAIWLLGFYFEALGDAQMFHYKKDPSNKGKVMNRGLWKYTRHPNYFGEATMWWGIFIIAIPSGYIWFSVFSPIVITLLIIKITGVELLEKKYKDNPQYQLYIKTTNSFLPWFPRSK